MLFLGLGAVGITLTAILGGWVLYNEYFSGDKGNTESEVPVMSYYHDAEFLAEPQAGIKYLVEDESGVDEGGTLDAVVDWIQADEPNIFTGDWQAKVSSWNDVALIEIDGDASTMIEDRYADVVMPYIDGDNNFETVTVDLEFV